MMRCSYNNLVSFFLMVLFSLKLLFAIYNVYSHENTYLCVVKTMNYYQSLCCDNQKMHHLNDVDNAK